MSPMIPENTSPHLTPRNFSTIFPRDTRDRMLSAINKGNTLRNACRQCRVNYDTLLLYFKYIKEEFLRDPIFHIDDVSDADRTIILFYQDIEAAKASAEAASVNRIREAQEKDWKAAKYLLETQAPEDWAPPSTGRPALPVGTPSGEQQSKDYLAGSGLDLSLLTSDELTQLEILITKATPGALLPQVEEAQEVTPKSHRLDG